MTKQQKIENCVSLLKVNDWKWEDYILEEIEKAQTRLETIKKYLTNESIFYPGLDLKWLKGEVNQIIDMVKLGDEIRDKLDETN